MIPAWNAGVRAPHRTGRNAAGLVLAVVIALPTASCDSRKTAGSGISYTHDRVSRVPWSIHVLKVDRSRSNLELHTTLAQGHVIGLSTLVQQVQALPAELGQPLAAINGDFYVADERNPYVGDPRGLQILDGELVSAPTDQASFWINAAGQPQATNLVSELRVRWPDKTETPATPLGLNEERLRNAAVLYTPRFGNSTRTRDGLELILERDGDTAWLPLRAGVTCAARVREVRASGDSPLVADALVLSLAPGLLTNSPALANMETGAVLRISTATVPGLAGVKTAISGGYVLIRDGKKETLHVPETRDYKYRSVRERHPRSAIGASRDHLFFVEVDGRQPGLSVGMTLSELADYMLELGCEMALSLDGGASSTFWLNGTVMNSPCNGGVRPIANGLVLVQKPGGPDR